MTTETLMTEQAATTPEGQAASQAASTTTEAQAPTDGQTAQQQQATDGQSTEGQQADGANTDGDAAKPEGAPEQYEFKAAEGREFDPAVIAPFSEVAKELDLPQEAAQKILDKMAPVIEARQIEQINAVKTEWATQSRADKEFGGDKLQENLTVAIKARDAFASPELRTLLDETGLGNHPEVIRFFYRAGKAISEDGFVPGGRATAPSDPAKRLFPNQA